MTLGQKTVALFLTLGLAFSVGCYIALKVTVFPTFNDFERETALGAAARADLAIQGNLRAIEVFAKEYAIWDDTHEFAQGLRPSYKEENLNAGIWSSLDVDVFIIFDAEGRQLYANIGDVPDGTPLAGDFALATPLSLTHPLLDHRASRLSKRGIIQHGKDLLLVVSHPILTSLSEGPIAGSIVVGQLLNKQRAGDFSKRTTADVKIWLLDEVSEGSDQGTHISEMLQNPGQQSFLVRPTTISSSRVLEDLNGDPVGVIETVIPRRVTRIGEETLRTAAGFLGGASIVFLLAAWLFMRQLIVAPVNQLTRQILGIRQSGDLSTPIVAERSDEIGLLTNEFAYLTGTLHEEQQRSMAAQLEAEDSRDAALLSSQAKSEFLATMSHEIRTPMNGVLGMTELLLSSGLDRRQSHLANAAHRSAEGLLSIINDILDFSKIEARRLELDSHGFDLNEVCEDALELVADEAHRKGLELVSDLQPLTPRVIGDPTRIRQVLVNLLANATKFTQSGEVRLRQRFYDEGDGRVSLHFEVRDTGVGIDKQHLDKVFDAFAQADNSTSRSFGGTGLGLTICSRLVGLMGGELIAESEKSQGSCFSFELSLMVDNTQAARCSLHELQAVKALVVDDHGDNRQIMQNQLASWGLRSDSAESGREAIHCMEQAAADGDPFRVALFDCHMPEMDGIELAKLVAENPRVPDMPVLVLSSNFEPGAGQLHPSIVNQFLTKPVRRRELEAALRSAMGKRKQGKGSKSAIAKPGMQGHVLLAEDNRVNQEVAAAALEAAGCRVTVVENGRQALESGKTPAFDLILMDCHMPVMDGLEATEELRRWEVSTGRQRIPIIALTADVRKGIQEQCSAAGMDGYLSKPFSQSALATTLGQWLDPAVTETDQDWTALLVDLDLQHFDIDSLQQLLDLGRLSGRNVLQKTLRLYQSQFPELMSKARQSLREGSLTACAEAAHSLKSASSNIGAVGLAKLCGDVEQRAREEVSDGIDVTLDRIDEAFAAAREDIVQLSSLQQDKVEADSELGPIRQRILIADDDPAVRLMLSESLVANGYAVDECADGAQAFRSAKTNPPDLILLDAQMPEMNGFDVCQRMSEDPALCMIPVMMITGLDDISAINRAFSAGATAFTHKPIKLPLLLENLRFLLRANSDAKELRQSKTQLESAQRLARVGYWQWQISSAEFRCSEQLESILGYDIGSIGSDRSRFLEIVRDEDRAAVANAFKAAAASGEADSLEYRIRTGSGHEMLVRQETEVKRDVGGDATVFAAVQDVSAQRAAEDKIRKLAYYDPLTALASRSYFMQKLGETVKSAARHGGSFAIFMMDLDGFKDVNDSLGHDIGDDLLRVVADRLRSAFRDTDFLGRLGGDEFCAIIDDSDDSLQVAQIAERCLAMVEQPVSLGVKDIRPRVSIGIAQYPSDGDDDRVLMKAADDAMYSAKQRGKHRFEYYDASMTSKAENRLSLVGELRNAFLEDQFLLHYQPLIELESGRVTTLEALVRWQHPTRGLVPPAEFIDELERTGMIGDLGRWVLRTACAQASHWHQSYGPIEISVNISANHLQESDAVASLQAIVEKSGLSPNSVVLEVTENTFQRGESIINTVVGLQKLGFKIAIDDFGTGFSSLEQLQTLPIDLLKIDRNFVRNLEHQPKDSVMLGGIANVARALGVRVIAEGVEEFAQLKILESLGCDQIQGFYFSHPVPQLDVPSLLETNFLHTTQFPRATA